MAVIFHPIRSILLLLLIAPTLSAEKFGPWDLDALKSQVPATTWLRKDQTVHSLTYSGESVKQKPTDVFAFYASPRTLGVAAPNAKFPGVVLIHGGGGTAFAEWVHLWAKRGYAAIAMDLNGSRPKDPEFDESGAPKQQDPKARTRLPKGGLSHGHSNKFGTIGGDTSDDWPFHAIASVMRAHTLLRSFPEVDVENTAVTGVSWGGYTTCLVASLDDRFKAAVPVYGCGFIHEGESVQKPSIDKLGARAADWVKAYDPSSLLPRCRIPIFFVNGTNDPHYPLDSSMKTYNLVSCEKHMRINVKMPHSSSHGWAPHEIGLFIDSKCRGGIPLPVPGKLSISADAVQLTYTSATPLKSAQLHYTTDEGLRSAREWTSVPAKIQGENTILASNPPAEANTWFISLTDDRDAMVITPVQLAR